MAPIKWAVRGRMSSKITHSQFAVHVWANMQGGTTCEWQSARPHFVSVRLVTQKRSPAMNTRTRLAVKPCPRGVG